MRRPGSRVGRWWSAVFLVFLLPTSAEAHSTVKGISDFWTGALHPLMTPPHVLILLALGLGLGQWIPLKIELPLGVFALSAALGLAMTMPAWFSGVHPAILTAVALVAASVVALETRLPLLARAALCGIGALLIGLDSGVDTGAAKSVLVTLLGTWISLTVVLMNIIYFVSLAADQPRKWLHIGIRVAGSWIVAISLLMLAFALRK